MPALSPPPPPLHNRMGHLPSPPIPSLFLSLFLLLLSLPLLLSCSPSNLTCSVCPTSSHANSIPSLPRVTSSAHSTSSNLGSYDWYTCAPSGSPCQSYWESGDSSSYIPPNGDSTSPDNYIQSLLAYSVFALCCALVCTSAVLLLFVLRYCVHRDTGGLGGNRFPTARPEGNRTWGSMVTAPPIGYTNQGGEFQYPPSERWLARGFMALSVALVFAWVAVGWWAGGSNLHSELNDVVASPSDLVVAVQQTQSPVQQFIAGLGEEVLAGMIGNVSAQLQDDVDLPELVGMLENITGMMQSLPSVSNVQAVFTQLQGSTSSITHSLSSSLPSFTGGFSNVSTVTSLSTAIAASSSSYQSLFTPLPQLLSWLSSNTTTLVRFSGLLDSGSSSVLPVITQGLSGFDLLPSSSFLANVTSLLSALVNSTATSPLDPASRALLVQDFLELQNLLNILPPFESIAAEMTSYNTYAGVILQYGSASNSLQFMNESTFIIAQLLPLLSSLQSNYTALSQLMSPSTFNFTTQAALLSSMNASLSQLPSLSSLSAAIQVIPNLASIIPYLASASAPLSVFSTQYLSLPNASTILPLYLSLLNASLPAASAQFALTQSQLQTFLSTASAINLNASTVGANLSSMAALSSTLSSLSNSSFIAYVPTLVSALSSLNFTGQVALLQVLQAAMVSAVIPSSTISQYGSLGSIVGNLVQTLSNQQSDILTWSQGYCASSPSDLCSNSTDCPSDDACLNVGVKRCANNPATTCEMTSDCPVNDFCLIDASTYTSLIQQINALWPTAPSTSFNAQLLSSLTNVSYAINALQPFSWQSPVAAVLPFVSAVPSAANLTNTSTTVASLATSFNSTLTILSYTSLLSSVQAINYTAAFGAVGLLNSSLTHLTEGNYSQQLEAITAVLSVLSSFLYSIYPSNYSALLSPDYLQSVYTGDDALVSLSTSLAITLTNLTSILASSPALSVLAVDGLAQTSTIRQWFYTLYSPTFSQYGAFHYFASIFDQFTGQDNLIDPTVESPNRWNDDLQGNEYENGRVCMTDSCLHNSIDWYYSQPLSTTTSFNVHVSPQTVTGPLLILPALLGVMGLLCLLCWWSYKCSKAMASITACVVFCAVPLLFFLAAFVFPVAMLQGDLCYGGANVGYQYVQAKQDTACNDFLGGVGTATDCVVGVDSLNATVDITGLLQTIATGQCDPGTSNSFDALFASLSSAAVTWPQTRVDTVAAALSNTSSIIIQPTLYGLLNGTAFNASVLLIGLIEGVQSTVSCERLYEDLMTVKSSFCCSLSSSLYWVLSVWFLIPFTLCCCEGPAAIFGRKRFSQRLVGATLAPGVRYDPYGEYEGDEEEGAGWRKVLAALGLGVASAAVKGKEGEMTEMQSPKAHDALLTNGVNGHKSVNGTNGWGGKPHLNGVDADGENHQCVVCLLASARQHTVDGCHHSVCGSCMRSHVQRQVASRRYPVLCPLSLLSRNGTPACEQPLSDEEVLHFVDDSDARDSYLQMQRIHAAIPTTTTPSSPSLAPSTSHPPLSDTPLPSLKGVIKDRYRPLPSAVRPELAPDANAHAFINTAGGSLQVLQHPHSEFAKTGGTWGGTGGTLYGTGGTLIGPVVYHQGGGAGTLERTMEGDETIAGEVSGRRSCPIVGCGGGGIVGGEGGVQATCDKCGYVWCAKCDTPWHQHMTCEEFQKWRRRALEREVEMYRSEQEQGTRGGGSGGTGAALGIGGVGSGMDEVREEEVEEEEKSDGGSGQDEDLNYRYG